MLYQNDELNLTANEQRIALFRADIPLDVALWDNNQMQRAAQVLDTAQAEKIAKLMQPTKAN